jgi:hypothetical protein
MPARVVAQRGVKIQLSTKSESTRRPSVAKHPTGARRRKTMDSNVKALLHVQSSLLLALCATHHDAKALEESFDFHLAQSLDRVSSSQEMRMHIEAWAKTFRVRMEREASPPPSG